MSFCCCCFCFELVHREKVFCPRSWPVVGIRSACWGVMALFWESSTVEGDMARCWALAGHPTVRAGRQAGRESQEAGEAVDPQDASGLWQNEAVHWLPADCPQELAGCCKEEVLLPFYPSHLICQCDEVEGQCEQIWAGGGYFLPCSPCTHLGWSCASMHLVRKPGQGATSARCGQQRVLAH